MAYLHTSVRFKCCSYLCMPVSSCVCVCVYIYRYLLASVKYSALFVSFSLHQLFACVALFGCCCTLLCPQFPSLSTNSLSSLYAFSLFRYFVLFVLFYHTVQAPQQTSPENWPIRARHLRRARPRLRLWRRVREEEVGEEASCK